MIHTKTLNNFKQLFPQYENAIDVWFPCGKNKVRVRLINGHEFIFTYNSEKDWRLETVDSFIKHM